MNEKQTFTTTTLIFNSLPRSLRMSPQKVPVPRPKSRRPPAPPAPPKKRMPVMWRDPGRRMIRKRGG